MIYYEPKRANPSDGIYHQCNNNIHFNQHLHDSFEMIYVYDGRIEITVDGTAYSVKKNQAILIFPNQIHGGHTSEYSKTYLCIFQNSLVGEFYSSVKFLAPELPVFDVPEEKLIEKISTVSGSRYLLKSYLYEMIHNFSKTSGKYVPRKRNVTELIGKILVYIAEHHSEDISMRDVALDIGYDYHYLSNLLQKDLNTTFRAILNEYRISHAKYLLTTRSDSIYNISHECGYESLCSFNRNFRKLEGITPSEYRNTYNG